MPNADPAYKTVSYRLMSKGLVARFVGDAPPENTYLTMENLESREENALSSRFGIKAISNPSLADVNVHTLGRMKGIGQNYRYAGAGTNLYRRAGDTVGPYTRIATGLSGNRFSSVIYRPDQSSFPYAFFCDSAKMLKDNGSVTQQMGIFPPTLPAGMALQDPLRTVIDLFDAAAGSYTQVNIGGIASSNRVNTTLATPIGGVGVQTAQPVDMANILPGVVVVISAGNPDEETVMVMDVTAATFTASFGQTHLAGAGVTSKYINGTVAANTLASIAKTGLTLNLSQLPGSTTVEDNDVINLWVNVSDPSQITGMSLLFDVSDGSFTKSYYQKAITPDTIQAFVSKQQTAPAAVTTQATDIAVGVVDTRQLGVESDQITQPDPSVIEVQPQPLATGLSIWTRIQIKRSEFIKNGIADTPGYDWAKVNGWMVTVQTTTTGTITLGVDDLFLYGGAGPDSFGGVGYDYRVTFYNANTGAESNPSQPIAPSDKWLLPRRQPIAVTWLPSPDSQVTHARVYRRGGTLPSAWYKVGEVAVGTTKLIDTLTDALASGAKQLEIDNDPPVTSTLKIPVDTTLGTSVVASAFQTVTPPVMTNIVANQYLVIDANTANEETVIVAAIVGGGTQFSAFFQYAHGTTARVQGGTLPGRPLYIAAQAFERIWLAGDPDNPHILYYSKAQRPESFSPANALEVGTPGDPIMAIVPVKTNLYVFTLGAIYLILGQGTPQPIALKISQGYGLTATFGWCLVGTTVYYQSFDGIYAFYGYNDPTPVSEIVEWLWTNQSLGPVVPADPAQLANTVMAAKGKEVFIVYTGIDSVRRRVDYFTTFKRFRNDAIPATAMLVEQDTQNLMVGFNGMVYQDRVGDYDESIVGAQTPIAFTLQTPFLDQGVPKADKVYNEFTVDINTNGEKVGITLRFNNGDPATDIPLGYVTTASRKQMQFNINGGKGFNSRNVQVILTGSVTHVVHVFEYHIRVWVEAEFRQSWDTYWDKYGTDMWKVIKQGYFEYVAPSGIVVSCYLEGNTTPEFTFFLPATTQRTARRIRFPAVKGKIFRWTGTSVDDFQFYDESHLEVREVCSEKGYAIVKLTN